MSPKWMFWPRVLPAECNTNEIPVWTSGGTFPPPYTHDGHIVTGVDESTEYALWNVYRGVADTNLWAVHGGTPDPVHNQVKFPELRRFNSIDLRLQQHSAGYGRAPQEFEVMASNNGNSWTQLFYINEIWSGAYARTYQFPNEDCYQYYKFNVIQRRTPNDIFCLEYIRYYYDEHFDPEPPPYDGLVPPMIYAIQYGFHVTRSSAILPHEAPNATRIDGDLWSTNPATSENPQWWRVELPEAAEATELHWYPQYVFGVNQTQRCPKAFKVQGSNNGTDWTDLAAYSDIARSWWDAAGAPPNHYKVIPLSSGMYKYYRVYCTDHYTDSPPADFLTVETFFWSDE